MKFNFDEAINRRGTCSVKWDAAQDGVLPMWVADMDFRTAPCIVSALERRARHGIYGYARVPEAFYEALAGWFAKRHAFKIQKEWVLYTTGVVPALSAVIKALTVPGDKVVIQEPVYNCFFSSIKNNGCEILSSNLILKNGVYEMDFEDLEVKLSDPRARVFLLCSPHNPAGRVWTREELKMAGDLCAKHRVTVISDGIHCDLTLNGRRHIPFGSLGEAYLLNSVTCVSPSKSFNLAGLQVADIIAADREIREKIDRALNINEVCQIGPFAIDAQIAAYTEGAQWLDELRVYLQENFDTLKEFIRSELPRLSVVELEATYLPWIDCRALGVPSDQIFKLLYEKGGLWLNSGTMYGSAGEGFVRMNIACPRAMLLEGCERMKIALE